jgi:hypothetical protein
MMDIEINGLSQEKMDELSAAFSRVQVTGRPEGISDQQWAKRCILNFIRSVIFAARKEPLEAQARAAQQSVAQDFQ